MADREQLSLNYGKWLDKKLRGKPMPVQIMQRRTMNTATLILANIDGIPFEEISCARYFFYMSVVNTAFFHHGVVGILWNMCIMIENICKSITKSNDKNCHCFSLCF